MAAVAARVSVDAPAPGAASTRERPARAPRTRRCTVWAPGARSATSLVAMARRAPVLMRRTRTIFALAGASNFTTIPLPRAVPRRTRRATRRLRAVVDADRASGGPGAWSTIGAGAGAWMTTGGGAGAWDGVPLPVRVNVCGPLSALPATVRVAVRTPVACGVKPTPIVQLAPGAVSVAQPLAATEKSPASVPPIAAEVTLSGAVPWLASVTFAVGLAEPTCRPLNVSALLSGTTNGAAAGGPARGLPWTRDKA